MTAKEWAENKTFSFRNDLPWTGLDWTGRKSLGK